MPIRCYQPSPTFYDVNEIIIGEIVEIEADLCIHGIFVVLDAIHIIPYDLFHSRFAIFTKRLLSFLSPFLNPYIIYPIQFFDRVDTAHRKTHSISTLNEKLENSNR